MSKRTIFSLFIVLALVLGSVLGLPGQPVAAQDHAPAFSVFIESNHVKGWDWPLDAEITMEIDDPATPQNPDYSETRYAHEVPGSFNEVHFGPEEAFEMQVGYIVTLAGGGYAKDTIITYLYLGGADMLNDRLWGKSDPYAVVTVKNFHNRDIVRWETADATGSWEADFGVIGDQPGEELDDFGLGTRYMISREDGDGDKTQLRDWEMPFPSMVMRLSQNLLEAQDWPFGYPVDVAIDDPDTGPGPDYSTTISPEPCHYDAEIGCFFLLLGESYRVYPGDTITLSNGFLAKTLVVSAFQVSSLDYAADLVCGTAELGLEVETRLQYHEAIFQRYEMVAGDGTWCADFSVTGDDEREQDTYDLLPFTEGVAFLHDEDGDGTQLTFPYYLVAWPEGEHIDGYNWLADIPVTLQIDDPLTLAEPDYTASATPDGNGPWYLTGVKFELDGLFDIQPGHIVRFIQGGWLKELVVSGEVGLTELNYLNETVSGTAAPGAHILTIHGYGGPARVTIADSGGDWSVDYGVPGDHIIEEETVDLSVGDNVMAAESDEDADSTNVSAHLQLPWIDAEKTFDDVIAVGYARGGTVTLTVDDPATAESPDYTTTQVIGDGTAPWNYLLSYQPIVIPDWLDLQTGMILNIFDDEVTKQVVLSDHEITNVNLEADMVFGVAAPGTQLRILLFNEGIVVARRAAVAQVDGIWSADFSVAGSLDWEQDVADIHTGSSISASHFDEDSDRTRVDWIYNHPPAITSIQAPADPVPVNTSVEVSATFNDPDPGDAHSAVWDWGDDTTSGGAVEQGSSTITGSHVYAQAGVYTLSLTLCDAAGECDTAGYQYVVVYDPDGGFVTGGGWIDSPAGAYMPDPDLTGPAHFGFVAKYKKGAVEPDGNTQFQFQVADLNFHSDSYQWLVIAGSKAMFKGTGAINYAGEYGFMISAVDSDLGDNGDLDCFRIKIWDLTTQTVIYDNQLGAENDAEPTTQLAAGSIVIHKVK